MPAGAPQAKSVNSTRLGSTAAATRASARLKFHSGRNDLRMRITVLLALLVGFGRADSTFDFLADLENELQPKSIAKKSVEDEQEIRAAEAYEFEYLHPDYEAFKVFDIVEPVASASHDDHHEHHHKVGYSVGGPLVNIAQGAAAQTENFEKSQPAAAAQAAYVAKNRLGQSAGLSAATAAAAFAGKRIIYRGLQQQAYNAHRALESEKLQLQQAQRAATAAAHSAQQAMHQVQIITTALNTAQATSEHASAASSAAAAELAAQTAMVGAAKARLHAIEEQLHHARIDFEAAQHANFKAAHAALVAQNNAAAAAAHAAEVANKQHHHHHHDEHHHKPHEEHHHKEKLEALDEDATEEDHDHNETVQVTVSKPKDDPAKPEATTAGPQEFPGALNTVASVGKDEAFDSYDSFPY